MVDKIIFGIAHAHQRQGQVPLRASDPHSLDVIPRAYRNLPARGGYSPCSTAKRPSVRGSVPATRPCRKNPYSPFTGSSERGSEDRELSHCILSTSKGREERRIERAGAKIFHAKHPDHRSGTSRPCKRLKINLRRYLFPNEAKPRQLRQAGYGLPDQAKQRSGISLRESNQKL